MRKGFFIVLLVSVMGMFSGGCNQEPGVGGSSTIIGKLYLKVYNEDFSLVKDEHYLADEYVYILDGDNVTYRERVRTNYDGAFEFPFLKKGKYTIYAYSMDTNMTVQGYSYPIVREVEITSNRQLVEMDDIVIYNDNGNSGNSRINGKVFIKNYNSSYTQLLDEYYAPDFDVYLIRDNSVTYDDKETTSFDGGYEFRDLPKGHYTLYVYSDDSTGQSPTGSIPVIQEIDITENGQVLTLPDFIVVD